MEECDPLEGQMQSQRPLPTIRFPVPPQGPPLITDVDPKKRRIMQQHLVVLLHAHYCRTQNRPECIVPYCKEMKIILDHWLGNAKIDKDCPVRFCYSSIQIFKHWKKCKVTQAVCSLCSPANQVELSDLGSVYSFVMHLQRTIEKGLYGSECAGGGTADTCSICLNDIAARAFPDMCVHTFCYECITSWSKKRAACPLCGLVFRRIYLYTGSGPFARGLPSTSAPRCGEQEAQPTSSVVQAPQQSPWSLFTLSSAIAGVSQATDANAPVAAAAPSQPSVEPAQASAYATWPATAPPPTSTE